MKRINFSNGIPALHAGYRGMDAHACALPRGEFEAHNPT